MKKYFSLPKNTKYALAKAHRAHQQNREAPEREQGARIANQPKSHMAPETDYEPADQESKEEKGSKLIKAARKVRSLFQAAAGKVLDAVFIVVEFFVFVYLIYKEGLC
jgi:type IV secretory pathway VirB10-like protein